MKIAVKTRPETRYEVAARAAHDILFRKRWVWEANKTVEIPEELVEDVEQIIRIKKEGEEIVVKTHQDILETIIEWLQELAAWGFKPAWLPGEIPDK